LSGIYARNRYFDTTYTIGAQELYKLETDVYLDDTICMTVFESYEDYLPDGWPDFIRDFCE